jgi:small subunit ribosomal protein S11
MTKGDKTSAAEGNDAAIEQVSNDTSEATTRESRPGQLTAADLLRSELDGDVKIRRAKKSKNVASGICHILATFNNTKVSFSDKAGAVISWSSAGKNNFRGSRKSTAYAAQVAVQDAARTAMSHGLKEIDVRIKGPGLGRDAAVRALQSIGLQVNSIMDVTPLPHNGCRPKKPRRA